MVADGGLSLTWRMKLLELSEPLPSERRNRLLCRTALSLDCRQNGNYQVSLRPVRPSGVGKRSPILRPLLIDLFFAD